MIYSKLIKTFDCKEEIWSATYDDDRLPSKVLYFFKPGEYVNAHALCYQLRKRRDIYDNWTRLIITEALFAGLRASYVIPTQIIDCDTFIHITLVPHLTAWLCPRSNYVIFLILEEIHRLCNGGDPHVWVPKSPPTNVFAFFEISQDLTTLHRYYAMECKSQQFNRRHEQLKLKHPKCELILKVENIPRVRPSILSKIKKDYKENGNICICNDGYCGSKLPEPAMLNLLWELCDSKQRPSIMRSDYDSVDNKYDYEL